MGLLKLNRGSIMENKDLLTANEARMRLHSFLKQSTKNIKKAIEIDNDMMVLMAFADFASKAQPYLHVSAQLAGVNITKGEESEPNGEQGRDDIQPDV